MVKAASVDIKVQNIQTSSSLIIKKKKFKTKKSAGLALAPKNVNPVEASSPDPSAKTGTQNARKTLEDFSKHSLETRYPILKDEELVQRFLDVPMNNNQKGRLRLQIKDQLRGTSDVILPDVIYNRIQAILKGSTNLTDTDLRKIRILYNMLTTALKTEQTADTEKKTNKKNTELKNVNEKGVEQKSEVKKEKKDKKEKEIKENEKKEKKPQSDQKPKRKKRYVVFLGNLPLNIDKEKILSHFAELGDQVVDVRIPKRKEESKSAIAYVELTNEPTFELALSKHHSMLGNRRINVLYTTQKNGKITKSEAKSKSAKLIALQKSGRLLGSIPANRKRSHRRMKMKRALAQQEQERNL